MKTITVDTQTIINNRQETLYTTTLKQKHRNFKSQSCQQMSLSYTGANLRWQGVWKEKESCSNWTRNWLESINRQVIDINELPLRWHAKLVHILGSQLAHHCHVTSSSRKDRSVNQLIICTKCRYYYYKYYFLQYLLLLTGWQERYTACKKYMPLITNASPSEKVEEENQPNAVQVYLPLHNMENKKSVV